MNKMLQIPHEWIPKEFREAKFSGVFLVFVSGKSQKEIEKKTERIKKAVEFVKEI